MAVILGNRDVDELRLPSEVSDLGPDGRAKAGGQVRVLRDDERGSQRSFGSSRSIACRALWLRRGPTAQPALRAVRRGRGAKTLNRIKTRQNTSKTPRIP